MGRLRRKERTNEGTRMNETAHNTKQTRSPALAGTGTGILLLLSLIALMIMYTETMLIAALPTIQTQFNTTTAWTAWVISIYLVVGAVATPILGKLGDSYGKRRFFLVAMVLYTVGVIGNGFAWSLASLLLFRAIQGIGLAIFPLAFAIIRDEFPPERVPPATGIVSAMFGVGAAVGLVVGSWVANNYGWQTTYHSVIPVALVLVVVAALTLKESPIRTPSRVDFPGAITFAIAIVSFLIAMTEGTSRGWTSGFIVSLLALAFVFIIVFIVIEMRTRDPMIDLAMLRKRNVFLPNITSFVSGLAMFMLFQSVVYLMEYPAPVGFGTDIFRAGEILAPAAAFMLVAGPVAGAIVTRRGAKLPLFIGAAILAASFSYYYLFRATQAQVALGAVFVCVGVSFMFTAMINIILQSVEQAQTGAATGMNTVFRTVGGSVGPTIAGVFLATYVAPIIIQTPRGPIMGPSLPTATAFDYIFLTGFGLAVVAMIVTLLIKGPVKVTESVTQAAEESLAEAHV